ncbi:MAG: hypothetical protein FWE08_03485 [Oscillospiraceae bacterium]|nr:hypothetical protein [Oscillospiraceae bacterium]
MTEQQLDKIMEQIAKKFGVTAEEVKREITEALDPQNLIDTPETRAFRASIPHKGEQPTMEETFAHLVVTVAKRS